MKTTAVVLLVWYCFMQTLQKEVKLGIGFRLTPREKIIYEGTTVLLYSTKLPSFNEDLLSNYTCDSDEVTCEIFHHIHTLASHTLVLLNHSLPRKSDLEDQRTRQTRYIEW